MKMCEIRKSFSLMCVALMLSALLGTCVAKPTLEPEPEPQPESESESSENIVTDANAEYLKTYAAQMMSYMNRSVAPCDDFYEYACGNWKTVARKRATHSKRNNLLEIIYTLSDVAEEVLMDTKLAADLGYGAEQRIAQQFYNACLGAQLYPLPASDPAYLALINSIGGFPAVNGKAWLASNFSWFNMSAHLTNYGAEGLIHDEVLPQYPFLPYFKLPDLGFDYIVHSDNIASNDSNGYRLNEERMRGYLKEFGLAEEQVADVIAGVFAFWRDVLEIADRFDDDLDKCDLLTETHITEPFPKWGQYYEIAWGGLNLTNYTLERYCDYYYFELDKVCDKHKPAVANYLAMKLLYSMDAKMKSATYQSEYCKLNNLSAMRFLLDKLYLVKYFTEETRAEITNIIRELRRSLLSLLENANWLDVETRKEALLKESTILPRIGVYKDDKLSDRLIRAVNNLTFIEGNYAQNAINLRRFTTYIERFNGLHHNELSNDTKPLELMLGMQVNAFYYNLDSSINVMAGILHPPAYHQAWPNSLKFGTIGYLVGHELTHGFDSTGARYDSNSDARYWWSKKSGEVFNERTKCYVNHFNSYLIPEINRKINGNQTKDENIADSGGLREALSAYRSHMKQQQLNSENSASNVQRTEQMPGLDMSPEQLFFTGFAQVWCADYEEEHYWKELTDEHTMDKYRVLGAVTNNEDFAQAFNCPLGSPMNPTPDKCRIW